MVFLLAKLKHLVITNRNGEKYLQTNMSTITLSQHVFVSFSSSTEGTQKSKI